MIRPITRMDFLSARAKNPSYYHQSRWLYYQAAIDMVRTTGAKTTLELGPNQLPLIKGGTCMDKDGYVASRVHDATICPWPCLDKEFDCFIALQVWEHLGESQVAAFHEVKRVARTAVLSFPFMWDSPHDQMHHMITRDTIDRWTLLETPVEERVVKCGKFDRLIRRYQF